MKSSRPGSFFSSSATPLAALSLLCLILCFAAPAKTVAVDYPALYAALAGSAEGPNGLKATWEVKAEVPGKTRENDEEGYAWLVVRPSLKGKELPELLFEGEYFQLTQGPAVPLVSIDDLNFDGHDDLSLVEGLSAHGAYGPVFLFNPGTGRFEASEAFGELSLQRVDRERKRLISMARSSACESALQEFMVKGFDQLELVYEEGTECPDDDLAAKGQYRHYKRSYKDGKLVSEEVELRGIE